jgi:ADP-heptose:LPS heptosyltransferase
LDIAETAYRKHGVHAAFIGVTNFPELPDKPYFVDFRQKLNLKRTAMLLHYSEGYVGNDTGPLHLANLMNKNSIGVYFFQTAVDNYQPIFPALNTVFFRPDKTDEIYPALEELVRRSSAT